MVFGWITCPQCGEPLQAGWKSCPGCEALVSERILLCPKCRAHIKEHWKICPICDVRLIPGETENKQENPQVIHGNPMARPNDVWKEAKTGMLFAAVPAGSFMMGSNSSAADEDEKPVHGITVEGFWMGMYPVTQKEWRAVMDSNPSGFRGCDDAPVETVSWFDAQEFIRTFHRMTGERFRLPTEAEWEYACRAGTTGDRYGSLPEIACSRGNSGNRTRPVGELAPNVFGLYDMLGNVWEWCRNWYGRYSGKTQNNPTGPRSGEARVIRGGSWGDDARYVRASNRLSYDPSVSCNFLGFRLVRERIL